MTIDQLEMIEAIVIEGSFHSAAKKLNKSQPSLSVGIKKIEDLYKIEIFTRQTYRPQLTDSGKVFFQLAMNTLDSYRDLQKIGHELGGGKESEIRIVIDPLVSSVNFHKILKSAEKELGPIPIYFQDKILDEPIKSLKSGQCDFAFGTIDNKLDPDIEYKDFCQVQLLPVISKNLVGSKQLTKKLLNKLPNIVVQSNDQSSNHFQPRNQRQWFVSNHALKEDMIVEGLGWGRLPKEKIPAPRNKSNLVVIPKKLIPPMDLSIQFLKSRRRPQGPIARLIWESV